MRLPRFIKGQSELSSTEMNELSNQVERLSKTNRFTSFYDGVGGKELSKSRRNKRFNFSESFLISIQAYTLVTPNIWKYDWQEIYPNFTSPVEPRQGGNLYENFHYAWNTIEMFNTNAGVQGNSINISDIGNLKLQPVGGRLAGQQNNTAGRVANTVVVRAFPYYDPDQRVVMLTFSYENAIDGPC